MPLRKPSRSIVRTLSQNIRRFRKELNISQEQLAEMCGLHRTYVGSVERGERNVTLSTLEAFSVVLGVSVSELLAERQREDARTRK